MRRVILAGLALAGLLCASVRAQESVYTSLESKQCKRLEFNEKEQYVREGCAGVGGYKLEVIEGDLRQTIDVVAPNGKKFPLDFQSNVSSAFSSLGKKAEWRVRREGAKVTPTGLIARFNASENPDDTTKITSYLIVVKITPTASCITNVVGPSPTANADAQRLADEAATKSCKTDAADAGADIRQTDFANFTFLMGKERVTMKDGLQDGACEKKDENGLAEGTIWNVSASSVAYGDLDSDGQDEAVVPLYANVCSGNMVTDDAVLVYTNKGGKLAQMPAPEYFDEGCKAGEKGCNFSRKIGVGVKYAGGLLVVETSFATDDDASCCPSLYRETSYKWNGAAFVVAKKGQITKREEK